ncbi:ccch zinc finger and rrm domain-containing [Lecanosticta acicola]|uniref:Ccch zinc finger and rrm domain-containing n=1 Tax=Lecanosticta acicola TaxID=111012 RepID=A0AAI8YXB3_9PEZI|nr:ccch zinc finger and rrm domain-containing [Lecanosticta acicola]
MSLSDGDVELLKKWLIKKLEDQKVEADSDVLSDYVLALVTGATDEPDEVTKANCVEQLEGFLNDPTKLVNEVFDAIANKSYDPSKPALKPTAPSYNLPHRASPDPARAQNLSKKRPYHDWDRDESQSGQLFTSEGGSRPHKQARRGGRGGDYNVRRGVQRQPFGSAQFPQAMQLPQMPTPPPGMPPFDPNNPMASFMAMQALGFLPQFSGQGQRCIDYDTKGFCAQGVSCPFEHGSDSYVMPANNDYDPAQSSLLNVQPTRTGVVDTSSAMRGRGGSRGRGASSNFRGGGRRAAFSHLGPNYDRSITTIVVEQIPEDQFAEENVREFFSEFGNIEKVDMQPYKRLATVKFDKYESAKAAYDSPKVIFGNRFVKVYWFNPSETIKSEGHTGASMNGTAEDESMQDEEPQFDPIELAQKQEEAQRKYEEQRKKLEETEAQRRELDTKMKAIEAERKKMADALAKKQAGKTAVPALEHSSSNGAGESAQTRALEAQLAKLEAEAKSLGIDPEAPSIDNYVGYSYPYRGRGGFRGRARGREGFNSSFRGGRAGGRVGGVMRLDNRPKTVSIVFHEGTYEDNEGALRPWLLFNESESATLTKHPSRQDTALLAFQQRYLAEQFMTAAAEPGFPLVGKVELSWYKADNNSAVLQDDAPNVDAAPEVSIEETNGREADAWDVAEDDDRWA